MSEINENKNDVIVEEYTQPSEAEKAFKKSKTKLIIKGVCLILAVIGNITTFLTVFNVINIENDFLATICLILIVGCYGGTILSNAVVGLIKQYLVVIEKCGLIVPFIGWIFGALFGLIAMIFFPALFAIAPFKKEFEKYEQIKLQL